jgi:nickel/cobalt exporter
MQPSCICAEADLTLPSMSSWSLLLVGVGLGLRHATDADHVLVVAGLVEREPNAWRAARVAALWGAGHTVTFLALGLLVILAGFEPSEDLERWTEGLVGLTLLSLGGAQLVRRARPPEGGVERSGSASPVAFGLLHGLAGSAGVAVATTTTIGSRALAAAYLALVATGTVVGMVALTFALAGPLRDALQRRARLLRAATLATALLSIALGIGTLWNAFAHAAPSRLTKAHPALVDVTTTHPTLATQLHATSHQSSGSSRP